MDAVGTWHRGASLAAPLQVFSLNNRWPDAEACFRRAAELASSPPEKGQALYCVATAVHTQVRAMGPEVRHGSLSPAPSSGQGARQGEKCWHAVLTAGEARRGRAAVPGSGGTVAAARHRVLAVQRPHPAGQVRQAQRATCHHATGCVLTTVRACISKTPQAAGGQGRHHGSARGARRGALPQAAAAAGGPGGRSAGTKGRGREDLTTTFTFGRSMLAAVRAAGAPRHAKRWCAGACCRAQDGPHTAAVRHREPPAAPRSTAAAKCPQPSSSSAWRTAEREALLGSAHQARRPRWESPHFTAGSARSACALRAEKGRRAGASTSRARRARERGARVPSL